MTARTRGDGAQWVRPETLETRTTITTPRLGHSSIFIFAILAGVGVAIAADRTGAFPKSLSPAGWGFATGMTLWVAGCYVRCSTTRRQVLGQVATAPTAWQAAPHHQALIAGAACEAANQLLREGVITAAQVDARDERLARRTAEILIRGAALSPCGNTVEWGGRLAVADAHRLDNGLYLRDGFNDGAHPVFPVDLRRQLTQPDADQRERTEQRWIALAQQLRGRYFDSFRLGMHGGRAILLVPEDGRPTHTVALMEQLYGRAAQELAEQYRVSQDEQIEDWFMESVHNLTTFHLLSSAQIQGRSLIVGSLRYDFAEQAVQSRNDLTEQSALAVYNEVLDAKRLLDQADVAQTVAHLLYSIRSHRGAGGARPPSTPLLVAMGTLSGLLREKYWPLVSDSVLGRVDWVGRAIQLPQGDGQAAEELAPLAELVPSVPRLDLLSVRPVAAPRRIQFGTTNPVTEQQLRALYLKNGGKWLTFGQLGAILKRWYVFAPNEAAVGHCLFGAVAGGAFHDQGRNYLALRAAVIRLLQTRNGQGDAEFAQRMARGEWGDNEALQALSDILARPIHVYIGGGNSPAKLRADGRLAPQQRMGDHYDAAPIELIYEYGCHYQWLQPT
jgi:hypothetical protein